jgi:hypothetical protein
VAEFVAALTAPAGQALGASRRRVSRWLLVPAAALAIALAVFALRRQRGAGRPEAAAPDDNLRVVAVLPFRNLSRDTAQQYFSAGMTEEIASELSRVAALRVLSRAAEANQLSIRKAMAKHETCPVDQTASLTPHGPRTTMLPGWGP